MKYAKQIVSLFLVLLILFISVPLSFATNGTKKTGMENKSTLIAKNGMKNIVSNLTEEQESENKSGYSIIDVVMQGTAAIVTVHVLDSCKLVVAIYDETTFQMLGSGTKKLTASVYSMEKHEDVQAVQIEADSLPPHFLLKAFLLDESHRALCKEYVCRRYTTSYESFLNTTKEDFAGKEIVDFDYEDEDFGVLLDDVIVGNTSSNMTYTFNNGVYTFFNATPEVKNLSKNDIFYYPLSDEIGDFLLIKVADISWDGTIVTITEDADVGLGDVFQFVRIDEDADFSDVTVREDELGSALTVEHSENGRKAAPRKAEINENESKAFSVSLSVSYPEVESDDKDAWEKGWKVTGGITYILQAAVSLYYDIRLGKDFYEFKTELTHTIVFDVTVEGEISCNKDRFKIPIGPKTGIPIGVFCLYITVYPLLSFNTSMTFAGVVEVYNCNSFTDSNGFENNNETKWIGGHPDIGKTEVEIKVGLGVAFDFGYKIGKEDKDGLSKVQATVSVSFEAGIKLAMTPSMVGLLFDKHHDCYFCLGGSMSAFVTGVVALKFKLIAKKLTFTPTPVDLTLSWKIGDCYFSENKDGLDFGFGSCPRISHKVTVIVQDQNGDKVQDVTVSTTTGYCDENGDDKYEESSMKTNEDGMAIFFFRKGEHIITAKKDSIGSAKQEFSILSNAKEITLYLSDLQFYNGNYYKAFDESISWSKAKAYCEELGGHLATIMSEEENDFVYSLIKDMTKNLYWLGGTDNGSQDDWEWITGEVWDYTNWGATEPNNKGDGENYLEIYRIPSDDGIHYPKQWNDNSDPSFDFWSVEYHGFVCEWESKPSKTKSPKPSKMLDKTSIQLETETVVNGTIAMRSNVYPGKEYILIVVKNANADNLLDSDNLLYIDQKTTESDTVSFDFVPREDVNDFTATIYGVSHLHVSGDPVRENETAATYTSGGSYDEVIYCSACGAELSRETKATDKLTHEHSYQPEVTTDPTCTESGETTYTCSVCGDTYTETIPATGTHIDANNDGKCDTCKQQMTGGKHCKYCGKIHGGAFGWLTKFFHSILAIFKR